MDKKDLINELITDVEKRIINLLVDNYNSGEIGNESFLKCNDFEDIKHLLFMQRELDGYKEDLINE